MDPNEKDWGDPAAAAMAWEPTYPTGGANFRTHMLTIVSDDRWEFRATRGSKAFALAFVAFGVVALGIGVILSLSPFPWWAALVAFGASVLFIGGGYWLYKRATSPIVFDLSNGSFVGRRGGTATLADVRGLQLLTHLAKQAGGGDQNNYWSHELNLVLDGGERVHVVGSGGIDHLRPESERLSEALNVPLWDGAYRSEE